MRRLRHGFTLIELVAVLAILSLVAGFIITRANRIPAFLTIENSVNKVRALFLEATNQALACGETATVEYWPDSKTIRLGSEKTAATREEWSDGTAEDPFESPREPAGKKYPNLYSYTFPQDENFKVEFPVANQVAEPLPPPPGTAVIRYRFYPDGSADGPQMQLDFKGRKVLIAISPLTGMISVSEEDETQQR